MRLQSCIAVITGAAGGIGRALASEMAARGIKGLALVDSNPAVGQLSTAINAMRGGEQFAYPFIGQVTDLAHIQQTYAVMEEVGLPVNICVPAAGITRDSLSVKVDKSDPNNIKVVRHNLSAWQEVLNTNLTAPVWWGIEMVARITERRLKDGKIKWNPETEPVQGAVAFIGSVSSLGNVGQVGYASTKSGLEGAAASLTSEWMPRFGVKAVTIHPGYTDTPMVRAMGAELIGKVVLPHTQLKRLVRPDEIADAICFAVTNDAISGTLWPSAGWHKPA